MKLIFDEESLGYKLKKGIKSSPGENRMPFEKMDSEELRELLVEGLKSDRAATFKFFRRKLKIVCRSNPRFSEDQIDYIAGMLSGFALR